MFTDEKLALCHYRLETAYQALQDAETALANKSYDNAANRSYYCILHSVRAVLALEGADFKNHSGVFSHFRKEYIKSGRFDKHFSKVIQCAFDLRNNSDYRDFYIVSKEDVITQIDEAREFYTAISSYIEQKIK